MQKTLVILGLFIVVIGIAWPWLGAVPFGRLPGDIVIEKDGYTIYLPLATMVVVSVVISLIVWLFRL